MLDIQNLLGNSTVLKPNGTPDGIGMITPKNVVKDMVDLLPDDVWNKDTKFLDIACKSGNFLIEIYNRLINHPKLIEQLGDNIKYRREWILNNQLYGISMSEFDKVIATRNLYGYNTENSNIIYINNYIDNYIKSETGFKFFTDKLKETFGIMKFDVVIGNPPYNDGESRGDTGSGNSLYGQFMSTAIKLSKQYSNLIVPSGWMLQYPVGIKHSVVDSLRKNKNFKVLYDFKDSSNIFNSVSIPNGVCYYLIDNKKEYETCEHHIIEKDGEHNIINNQPLYNETAGVIFRDKHIINIISKINKIDTKPKFNVTCAGAKHHFDDGKYIMESNWREYSYTETDYYNIKYYVNERTHNIKYGYVALEQIPKNKDDRKRPKILVGQAFSAGSPQVMDIPNYVGENTVCSHSFVPIFSPNNSEDECLVICKYIKTKFFRYLVNVLKSGQNLGNRTYSLVPTQEFNNKSDINWNVSISDIDKQLYKKYKLSEEEIEYIEKTIKEMR